MLLSARSVRAQACLHVLDWSPHVLARLVWLGVFEGEGYALLRGESEENKGDCWCSSCDGGQRWQSVVLVRA